jgi:hypothetical protein
MVAQGMEVMPRRDDEEWQRHFKEKQHRQNPQEQATVGTFLSVMALIPYMGYDSLHPPPLSFAICLLSCLSTHEEKLK